MVGSLQHLHSLSHKLIVGQSLSHKVIGGQSLSHKLIFRGEIMSESITMETDMKFNPVGLELELCALQDHKDVWRTLVPVQTVFCKLSPKF